MKHEILAAFYREVWAIEALFLADMQTTVHLWADGEITTEQAARLTHKAEREAAAKRGAVALMPLHGPITHRPNFFSMLFSGSSSEQFGQAFRAMVHDDQVKAIVLDVDSPGGMVAGTDELSSMIYSARGSKPIVAHVNSRAASAAYWIASAADQVVVNPSAQVGSIGVLAAHDDLSARMEREGMKRTVITSAKYKAEGNPWSPLEPDARAHIQKSVDKSHKVFVATVARNRGVTQAAVNDDFGQGRMVDADDALKAGMADSIGTLDQTLARFSGPVKRPFAIERERRALVL